MSHFCTCHGMACGNLWPDWIMRIKFSTKRFYMVSIMTSWVLWESGALSLEIFLPILKYPLITKLYVQSLIDLHVTSYNKTRTLSSIQSSPQTLHSLGSGDTIWGYWALSTLVHVMDCCLIAQSHYLNQCWFIIDEVLWQSHEGNFIGRISIIYMCLKMTNFKIAVCCISQAQMNQVWWWMLSHPQCLFSCWLIEAGWHKYESLN